MKSYFVLFGKFSISVIFFVYLFTFVSFSQNLTDSLDSQHIYQKGKKRFINNKYLKNIHSFDELNPTCVDESDSDSYNYQYETFYIKGNINKIWNSYKHLSLPDIYSGHIINFGFMYSKPQKRLFYIDSNNYDGMKEGQVFFINLDLLGGLKKLIVAYEVTNIDDQNKVIQFCYIKDGVSEGSQKIILSDAENGYTKVQHNTVYKSSSKLRDKYIYPPFHKRIVKEFHKNLMVSIK